MALELLSRDVGNSAPAMRRTAADNHSTLLVSWWCTIFALVIILTRVIGRYVRTERLFREDKVMALSIIPLLIRMALVHVIMLYGTNNAVIQHISKEEIFQRSVGSRLVLASRIFYALFIWIAKFTVSEFLKRITSTTWNRTQEIGLKIIRGFLLVTFIGVVIGTLAECQPFDHYWQVVPDPGPACRNGYAQLLTMGISDIITDILLIVFPMPIIIKSTMPVMRKISLCLLFSLSLILLAIAAYRMPAIIAVQGLQQRRTLWASIEILAAAAVSNSVVIGSFVRDRGIKKAKFRNETVQRTDSVEQPSINRVLTQQHWGNDSDQDLFRSLGCRLNSVAEEGGMGPPVARAPQQVEPVPHMDISKYSSVDDKTAWGQKSQDLSISDSSSDLKDVAPGTSHSLADFRHASQNMSFYDIGGILEDGPGEHTPRAAGSLRGSVGTRDFATTLGPSLSTYTTNEESPTTHRSGFGGTTTAEDSHYHQGRRRNRFGPDADTRGGELQDIGGLLR